MAKAKRKKRTKKIKDGFDQPELGAGQQPMGGSWKLKPLEL